MKNKFHGYGFRHFGRAAPFTRVPVSQVIMTCMVMETSVINIGYDSNASRELSFYRFHYFIQTALQACELQIA